MLYIQSFAAEKFEIDGITYSIYSPTEKKVAVEQKVTGMYSGNIEIPEKVTYNGVSYDVSIIASLAFNTTEPISVLLPNSIEEINPSAFWGCYHLNEIIIPKSVKKIGRQAFSNCRDLSSIIVEDGNSIYNSTGNCNAIIQSDTLIAGCKTTIIPETVKCIGEYAFYGISSLSSIRIPNSVISIEERVFSNCNNLEEIEISNGSKLEKLGTSAFYSCKLKNITLPKTLKIIDNGVFSSCRSLTEIFIPKSVSHIGKEVFEGCTDLSSIVVEEGNSVYNSMGNCNAIIHSDTLIAGCKTTIIPETVKCIGEYAFYNISSLEYIEIPNSVYNIEPRAFRLCSQLKEVIAKIEDPFELGEYVFDDDSKASLFVPTGKVELYKTKGWNKFFKTIEEIQPNPQVSINGLVFEIFTKRGLAKLIGVDTDVKYVNIPSKVDYNETDYTVKEIVSSIFENSGIITLSIPESVATIGNDIIKDCKSLAAIEWNANFKCPSEFENSIINPNLLFYVKEEQYSPNNINNIIIGETAKEIILVDGDNNDFYCPKSFTAQSISYTHNYSLKTEKGICEGWESIALPFDVQTYMTTKGEAKPYKVATPGEKLFWLREFTASGMVEAEGIRANIPYIISMPNWDGYQDFYNIQGDVVFSSQDVIIAKTEFNPISVDYRIFWSSYQNIEKGYGIFVLNKEGITPSNTNNVYLPGSTFIGNLRNVKPFEAYFTYNTASATRAIPVSELLSSPSTIETVSLDYSITINGKELGNVEIVNPVISIYSQTGQLVKNVKLSKGKNDITDITAGIYIVNGTKILVK